MARDPENVSDLQFKGWLNTIDMATADYGQLYVFVFRISPDDYLVMESQELDAAKLFLISLFFEVPFRTICEEEVNERLLRYAHPHLNFL